MSSFVTDLNLFIVLYGVFSGIGCGINYMIPIVCSWEYYPNHRGRVTGLMLSAYGISSFIFTNLAKELVNPDN